RSLGFVFIAFMVAKLGTTSVAAYGVGGEVLGLIMVVSMSFMMATSVMVGRSVGSGNYERAEFISKSVAKMSFLVVTFLGILSFYFAEGISRMFVPNDPAVIFESIQYLQIISLFFGFFSLQQIFNGAFTGVGDTKISMVLAIISLWVLRIPIAYVLSNTTLGFAGICWSFPIANTVAAALGYAVFVRGGWKKKELGIN
ncbi:MAG: MATE family efflux transporter, partial [Candidatus Paceibacterota bacterium]